MKEVKINWHDLSDAIGTDHLRRPLLRLLVVAWTDAAREICSTAASIREAAAHVEGAARAVKRAAEAKVST